MTNCLQWLLVHCACPLPSNCCGYSPVILLAWMPPKQSSGWAVKVTHRCTHSPASTLLVNQCIILSQSKTRTSSTTRGQSSVKLALCNVKTRSGSLSPLFTCSRLQNSLPSALRQPGLSSSHFSHLLYLYLGFPVNGHFQSVGLPIKSINHTCSLRPKMHTGPAVNKMNSHSV